MIHAAAVRAYTDAGIEPDDIDSAVTVAEDLFEGVSIFDEYTPDQLGAVLKPIHTIAGDSLQGLGAAALQIATGAFDIIVLEQRRGGKRQSVNMRGFIRIPVFLCSRTGKLVSRQGTAMVITLQARQPRLGR